MCKKLSTLLKQKRWLMLTAGLLVIVLLLAAFAPIVPVAHKYPDPGTPEWSSVDTGEKLVGEVSAYHASRMTNWALLDTVADWPFLINVGAFGSLTTGVEAVTEQTANSTNYSAFLSQLKMSERIINKGIKALMEVYGK